MPWNPEDFASPEVKAEIKRIDANLATGELANQETDPAYFKKADTNPLREALEPFAKLAEFVSESHRDSRPIIHGLCVTLAERLTIGDLRRAKAALASEPVAGRVTSTEIWNAAESLRSLGAWQARAANILHDEIVRRSAPPALVAEDDGTGDVIYPGQTGAEAVYRAPAPAGREDLRDLRLIDWAYLYATEGAGWPDHKTIAEPLIALADQREPTQSDADHLKEGGALKALLGATVSPQVLGAGEPISWRWRFASAHLSGGWSKWISLESDEVKDFRNLQGDGIDQGRIQLEPLYATPPAPGAADSLRLGDAVYMNEQSPYFEEWRHMDWLKVVSLRIDPGGKKWASVIEGNQRHRGYGAYDGETDGIDADHLSTLPRADGGAK